MKNKKLLICILNVLLLVSCNNGGTSSSSEGSSSSNIDSSSISISESESSSLSSENQGNNSYIDQDKALSLVVNAEVKDIGLAKTSESSLLAVGYDGGRKYNQVQTISSTSYLNDLTISSGTVSQYFYDSEDIIFEDTFFEVKLLDENHYITAKDYVSDIFQDEIEKLNLLLIDPSLINDTIQAAKAELSCGMGSQAMADLYDTAIVNQASIYYSARKLTNGNLELVFDAIKDNAQSNQKYISKFTYIFDSLESGFLLKYTSEQSYYPYSTYENAEDKNSVEPTYYAKFVGEVKKGILEEYKGDLPVDVTYAFVSEIRLSASKTTIEVDQSVALKYVVLPETALNKDLHFSSSNENVARVDSFGRVTGIGVGSCEIIATNVESGVEGRITINVIPKTKPDAGNDEEKGDLLLALQEAKNRVFAFTKWIGGDYVESIAGMCIDSESLINSEALSELSISDFAYDEVERKATYIGDYSALDDVIPFIDNGNENLSNSYLLKKDNLMYHDVTLGFEIYLAGDNTIHYLKFDMACGYIETEDDINLATLSDDNIDEVLGEFTSGYKRNMYYISQGVISSDE